MMTTFIKISLLSIVLACASGCATTKGTASPGMGVVPIDANPVEENQAYIYHENISEAEFRAMSEESIHGGGAHGGGRR